MNRQATLLTKSAPSVLLDVRETQTLQGTQVGGGTPYPTAVRMGCVAWTIHG